MQSMILHKIALASLGPEKFFILSPNVRIEKRERASTRMHLYEFTQLEIEIAHGTMRDVFTTFEDVIVAAITAVKEPLQRFIPGRELSVPKTPFKVRPRTELEKEYGREWENALSKSIVDPVWVTNIPREFYDYQDETTGEWHNYDLFLPDGYGEVISGAEREREYTKILRKIDKDGLKKNEYSFLLRLAKDGLLKPMAGAGLGIERFVAYICAAKHIADVQPFPRIPGLVPDL
jgi:asparaginyl-tRNA synthetase